MANWLQYIIGNIPRLLEEFNDTNSSIKSRNGSTQSHDATRLVSRVRT